MAFSVIHISFRGDKFYFTLRYREGERATTINANAIAGRAITLKKEAKKQG